ncbi:MAG: ATP-grasp domain-containing protein [Deferribacterales bacterium]
MPDKRVVVVGSTADYNEIIHKQLGDRVLFLTDIHESLQWDGYKPPLKDECLTDLTDTELSLRNLKDHMTLHKIKISGVACFDCESLPMASAVADALCLPFPSSASIDLCRSKSKSHKIWEDTGVLCPRTRTASSLSDIDAALSGTGFPAVLKPATGSGSELVFLVNSADEAQEKFRFIEEKLAMHHNTRMYGTTDCTLEEYIDGTEYSCDWILKDGQAETIRFSRKIHDHSLSFGTTSAYVVPGERDTELNTDDVKTALIKGAQALGFSDMIAMTDMMVKDGRIYLLEMTPRIGGDCLPWLIEESSGLNMFRLAVNHAVRKMPNIPAADKWTVKCAVRIIADRSGIFDHVEIDEDSRITKTLIDRKSGHEIILPPENYDSRILGFVIFTPDSSDTLKNQAESVRRSVRIIYQNDLR